ncbi:sigma-70 family RNA polymerase sigma factor [Actinocorallia sp. A-T 12471]|uniref:sigma-70 family RNA polymerase sigma factor n=1 Tax=Actinocorallia sp. A-T 12471 TaxID=3089813 RepID=UPI0029CFF818|nr:sigma-70 family RNA polymerase sigma factor [Actinocorallia sp. A-T 12471]MDX6741777.1 sigma-70 family RNA polymerase sigma factor [Actinocorallia sp. A-T 12471]
MHVGAVRAEPSSPEPLVERARKGCRDAFADLYGQYVDLIYRYVHARVGAHPLAEDLTSETFARALRRIGDFTWQGRDFGAWLVTIARNLVADHYKSGRYRWELVTDEPPETPLDGPENAVLDALANQTLFQAVRRLGPDQRLCVSLRFLQGMSVAETAEAMGKNAGAVKALQHRAVRTLARTLPHDPRAS